MKITIYEYYSTDLHNQKYHYTAIKSEVEGRPDREFSGRTFFAELPDVEFGVDMGNEEHLYTNKGQRLCIIRAPKNNCFFLVYEESVNYGYSWEQSVYRKIEAEEGT